MAKGVAGRNLSRREFIRGISVGAAGVGLLGTGAFAAEPSAGGMKYRKLGRTGLMVSEISCGTVPLTEENVAVVRAAFERGVNFVDTASAYGKGKSEEALGGIFKNKSVRDKVIVCTKTSGLKMGADIESSFVEHVEGSLKRLQTDRVDIIMAPHGASAPEHVQNAEVFAAFEKLKKQGKARFLGVSTHGTYSEVALAAINGGHYDVVLTMINVANTIPALMDQAKAMREAKMKEQAAKGKGKARPLPEVCDMRPVLAAAVKKNVGIVAMKVCNNVPQEIRDKVPAHFGQASGMNLFQMCYKWVLSQPGVAACVPSMTTMEMLDQNLEVPHKKLAEADRRMLEQAVVAASGQICRMCSTCSAHCPRGVKVADILRYRMYYTAYGERELATESYRELAAAERVTNCRDCGTCEAVCPAGIQVRSRLRDAHRRLA
ncbi:MAG: hypothetical protein FJ272_13335 [Planctomycetes bacterium]|nr:hypothetical protein [Planctomycetota bacterium]